VECREAGSKKQEVREGSQVGIRRKADGEESNQKNRKRKTLIQAGMNGLLFRENGKGGRHSSGPNTTTGR
jgi:hypothetical protein